MDGDAEVLEVTEEELGYTWTEPVDTAEFVNGPSTLFVGGFSGHKTINDALAAVRTSRDAIVVLSGFDGDVFVDTTKYAGIQISAHPQLAIVVRGKLILSYSEGTPENKLPNGEQPKNADDEESNRKKQQVGDGDTPAADEAPAAPEDDEEAKPKVVLRNQWLSISSVTFTQGAEFQGLCAAYVDDCTFGQEASTKLDHAVVAHALSSVQMLRCTVIGSGKSAVYCFPATRIGLEDCNIQGAMCRRAPPEKKVVRGQTIVASVAAPNKAPSESVCGVGIFVDDAKPTITNCTISQFTIGMYIQCPSKGCVVHGTRIQEIATVGLLLDHDTEAHVQKSSVKLCGRECMVLGASHPTIRGNVFVGDVRITQGCNATGITDNIVGLNGQVINEETHFNLKGFTVVSKDPTLVKPKKVSQEE